MNKELPIDKRMSDDITKPLKFDDRIKDLEKRVNVIDRKLGLFRGWRCSKKLDTDKVVTVGRLCRWYL
tara:strand:- start:592 stop:795 length:204 start_codon:yes stop_codon:yes gene_type:complete